MPNTLAAFGSRQLVKITNADVRAWVARMQADGMSTSSLRKAVFALRRILAAGVADQRVTRNAADSVPLPGEQYGDQLFLTVDEVWSLAHAMTGLTTRCHGPDTTGERYRALVVVAAFGGLRFGELAALRRRHVDLLRGHVKVEDTLLDLSGKISFGPTKTKNGKRTVPLPRRALAELSAHMDAYMGPDPDALVFTTASGGPLRRSGFRRNWWMPATKAAGLAGLRFHDMRHTFVSLAISAGANAKQVSMRAGHSSVAFTLDRYGHLYDSADDQVTAAMDALIDRNDRLPTGVVVAFK